MKRNRQLAFVEDFAQWLDDGYSPLRTCQMLLQHAQAQRLAAEQQLLSSILQTLSQGKPLVDALQRHLDRDLCMMFAVGEQAGCLQQLLVDFQAADSERRQAQLAFLKPLLYPAAVSLFALGACYFVSQRILPALAQQLPQSDWPLLSRALSQVGEPWLTFTLVGVLSTSLLVLWGPRWLPGQYSRPGLWLAARGAFRIGRGFGAVILLQSLELLLRHGYNLDRAAQLLQAQSRSWLHPHLQLIRQRLAKGERNLAQVLDTGLLSPRMLFRLSNSSSANHRDRDADSLHQAARRAIADAVLTLSWTRLLLLSLLYALISVLMLLVLGGTGALLMSVASF
ncbi:MAG: type II secretion system F family protein [Idiomarina sp.]